MKPLFLLLFLSFFSININSQIPNGGFEEWEVDVDDQELPVSWGFSVLSDKYKIFKSTDSYSGSYSVGMETHYDWVVKGPVRILTMVKPLEYNYNLSLQFKIDSIEGDGGAFVMVYRDDDLGNTDIIEWTKVDLVKDEFNEINMPFTLQNLDTIIIALVAANQQIDIGFTGYTRVLFDAVELTPITSTNDIKDKSSLMLYPNPAKGSFRIVNLKEEHKVLKIINPLGRVVHVQMIDNDVFYFREEGVFFIALCNRYGEALEVIKLINR